MSWKFWSKKKTKPATTKEEVKEKDKKDKK